ncbi:hypothetical protein D5018_10875 [Parashewanella curva]|uniref:Death domain-containing protein n=1 Tax=Parashewanella curva TaxID=2338552 RepID=A0A3L8PXW0_9GAMM|nr:hypothetical protein [Parashewanella curva]RLV59649.1 hypothetical protein D5018_10875 [Parashewanella curva]
MSAEHASLAYQGRQLAPNFPNTHPQGMLPPEHQPQYIQGGAQEYNIETAPLAASAPPPSAVSTTASKSEFWVQQPPQLQLQQPAFQVKAGYYDPYVATFNRSFSQGIFPITQLPLTKQDVCASSLAKHFEPQIGLLAKKGWLKEFTQKLGLKNHFEQEKILAKAPDKNYSKCTSLTSFESVLTEAITLWQHRGDLEFTHLENAIRYWIEKTHDHKAVLVYSLLPQDRVVHKLPFTQYLGSQVASLHQQLQTQNQQHQFHYQALQAENHKINEKLVSQESPLTYKHATSSSETEAHGKLVTQFIETSHQRDEELERLKEENQQLKLELQSQRTRLKKQEQDSEAIDKEIQELKETNAKLQKDNFELLTQKMSTMMNAPQANIVANDNQGILSINVNSTHSNTASPEILTESEKQKLAKQVDPETLCSFMGAYDKHWWKLGESIGMYHVLYSISTSDKCPRLGESYASLHFRTLMQYWVGSQAKLKSYNVILNELSRITGKKFYDLATELLRYL